MPRGGEYSDGPTIQSDNPIESGENKVAGADVCLKLPHHATPNQVSLFQKPPANPFLRV